MAEHLRVVKTAEENEIVQCLDPAASLPQVLKGLGQAGLNDRMISCGVDAGQVEIQRWKEGGAISLEHQDSIDYLRRIMANLINRGRFSPEKAAQIITTRHGEQRDPHNYLEGKMAIEFVAHQPVNALRFVESTLNAKELEVIKQACERRRRRTAPLQEQAFAFASMSLR